MSASNLSTVTAAPNVPRPQGTPTIGQYLIDRLHALGARHVFGIPGDYVIAFYKMLEESPLQLVGTTNELAAGYAADAYARLRGIGVACVTYAVGGLSLANAVGGAYAEKSPVVVISGAAGLRERRPNLLLHHCVEGFRTQREVFERLTVASCALEDPLTALREIDRVLAACQRYKGPVYIELPRDFVTQTPLYPHIPVADEPQSDPHALAEAVAEAAEMLCQSRQPIIIVGIEVHRFGLEDLVLRLAETNQIPMAALLLSKSVIRENHPLYVGVYEAAMGRPEVTSFVEESDCVLMLGAFLHDLDTAMFTHNLDHRRTIFATCEQVRIRHHHYHGVLLHDFLHALGQEELCRSCRALPPTTDPIYEPWQPRPDTPITVRRLFQKVNAILDDQAVVLADPGDALFGAADLTIRQKTEFIGPSFYASMGFAVPGSIGAQCANPKLRPLVLVGDGAFQMTGMELGTAVRLGFNPVVLVLNNRGYGTERFLLEGRFNDIPNWQYHRVPEVLGAGRGFEVRTETELEQALHEALANRSSFSLLNIHIPENDTSPALRRLAERLAKRV
jgi:indolepyruvate decarboxylase